MSGKNETKLPKLPLPVGDRAAYIRKAAVALELNMVPTYKVVTYNLAYDKVETIEIPVSRVSTDANTKEQYYVDGGHISGGPPAMAKTHLSWLRSQALQSGATPDAIRLLSKATGAFTKKEENEMAEKLKAKSAPKAADKDGLKAAAKAAPVSKAKPASGKGSGKRGNPEALARARAARQTPNRKYKVNTTKGKLDLRDGSWTRHMVETIIANKDTDSAKAAHKASGQYPDKNLDFNWAANKGYITFA